MRYPVLRTLALAMIAATLTFQPSSCAPESGDDHNDDLGSTADNAQSADAPAQDESTADLQRNDHNARRRTEDLTESTDQLPPAPDLATDSQPIPEEVLDSADASPAVDVGFVDQYAGGLQTDWGFITGTCEELDEDLNDPGPSFRVNEYAFIDGETFDPGLLYEGARKRFDEPNAGGSSKCSEVMSLQLLHECEGATLYKSEMEVTYVEEGKITDFVVLIDGEKVGVSVTRAYMGPTVTEYSVEDATTLLEKKLAGINESTDNVSAEDKWVKQILHVWTIQPTWIPPLEEAYDGLDAELLADTIVLVTLESNSTIVVEDTCE